MSTITPLPIEGSWLISTQEFRDSRGSFREWLPNSACKEIFGKSLEVAQANFSVSRKGTLRGIHYSLAPEGQAKLVTCLTGEIYDVVVDLRPDSKTYGKWHGVNLSADSPQALYVGPGLGHAFLALEENSGVAYLLSSAYNSEMEHGINPFDKEIGISWPQIEFLLSDKDAAAPSFKDAKLK